MNAKQRIAVKGADGNPAIVMGFRHGSFIVYCANEKQGIWSLSTAGEINHLLTMFCTDILTHDSLSEDVTEWVSLLRAIATIFDLSGLSGCDHPTLEKMAKIIEEHVGLECLNLPPDEDDAETDEISWPIDGDLYRYWRWRKSNLAGVK